MTTNPPRDDAPERDQQYLAAIGLMVVSQRASTSYLSRVLSTGYNTASRIMERMQDDGIVAAPNHVGKREVLVSRADTPARAGMVKPHWITDSGMNAALMPTEAEPVAWAEMDADGIYAIGLHKSGTLITPLYATPPAAPTDTALVEAVVKVCAAIDESITNNGSDVKTVTLPDGSQHTGPVCDLFHFIMNTTRKTLRAALASRAAPPEAQVTVADRDGAYEAFEKAQTVVHEGGHIHVNATYKLSFWAGWDAALRALGEGTA